MLVATSTCAIAGLAPPMRKSPARKSANAKECRWLRNAVDCRSPYCRISYLICMSISSLYRQESLRREAKSTKTISWGNRMTNNIYGSNSLYFERLREKAWLLSLECYPPIRSSSELSEEDNAKSMKECWGRLSRCLLLTQDRIARRLRD